MSSAPDEPDIRRLLGAAVTGEPPLTVDTEAVYRDGKRLLRRRRALATGGVAAGVVLLAAGVSLVAGLLGRADPGPAAPPVTSVVTPVPGQAPPGPVLPLAPGWETVRPGCGTLGGCPTTSP